MSMRARVIVSAVLLGVAFVVVRPAAYAWAIWPLAALDVLVWLDRRG